MSPRPKPPRLRGTSKIAPAPSTGTSPVLLDIKGPGPTLFFTFLFFLCSADMFFAARIHDLNFRYGQFLLLLGALLILAPLTRATFTKWKGTEPYLPLFRNWLPFFLFYILSDTFSGDLTHSYLKWGWALFNIGGAAILCLHRGPWAPVRNGLFFGILAIAGFIWIEFIGLYWLPGLSSVQMSPASGPFLCFLGLPLGFVQDAGRLDGIQLFRPHAFFYEPSYAGCALSFAFPLCLALGLKEGSGPGRSILTPAFILVAAWMTSSRSAIFGTLFSLILIFLGSLLLRQKALLKRTTQVVLVTLLLFGLLALSARARTYADFFIGITEPQKMATRVVNPSSSEGWRMANILHSLKVWKEHPLLGMGVPPLESDRGLHGLGQTSESMWLEVGVETGLLGFLAYAFGLLKTMADAAKGMKDRSILLLVGAALAAFTIISMNLTSTFPRLDYWIIYFFAVRLLLEVKKEGTP